MNPTEEELFLRALIENNTVEMHHRLETFEPTELSLRRYLNLQSRFDLGGRWLEEILRRLPEQVIPFRASMRVDTLEVLLGFQAVDISSTVEFYIDSEHIFCLYPIEAVVCDYSINNPRDGLEKIVELVRLLQKENSPLPRMDVMESVIQADQRRYWSPRSTKRFRELLSEIER